MCVNVRTMNLYEWNSIYGFSSLNKNIFFMRIVCLYSNLQWWALDKIDDFFLLLILILYITYVIKIHFSFLERAIKIPSRSTMVKNAVTSLWKVYSHIWILDSLEFGGCSKVMIIVINLSMSDCQILRKLYFIALHTTFFLFMKIHRVLFKSNH